jgi:dGTP triphosphohydrolase
MENIAYNDYVMPRQIQADIEKIFGKDKAPVLINALEHGINQLHKKNKEQKILLKTEIKEEVLKELVTKETFQVEIKRLEDLIKSEVKRLEDLIESEVKRLEDLIESEVKRLEDLIKSEVKRLEDKFEEKFDKMFLMLKIILYTMIAGFLLFNPTFANIIATVFSVAK